MLVATRPSDGHAAPPSPVGFAPFGALGLNAAQSASHHSRLLYAPPSPNSVRSGACGAAVHGAVTGHQTLNRRNPYSFNTDALKSVDISESSGVSYQKWATTANCMDQTLEKQRPSGVHDSIKGETKVSASAACANRPSRKADNPDIVSDARIYEDNVALSQGAHRLPVWDRLYQEAKTRAEKQTALQDRLLLENKVLADGKHATSSAARSLKRKEWNAKWRKMIDRYQQVQRERERLRSHLVYQRLLEENKECTFRPRRYTITGHRNNAAERSASLDETANDMHTPLNDFVEALAELRDKQISCKKDLERCDQEEFRLDEYIKESFTRQIQRAREEQAKHGSSDFSQVTAEEILENLRIEAQQGFAALLERRLNLLHEATALHNAHYQWLHLHGLGEEDAGTGFDTKLVGTLRNSYWFQLGSRSFPCLRNNATFSSVIRAQLKEEARQTMASQPHSLPQRTVFQSYARAMSSASEMERDSVDQDDNRTEESASDSESNGSTYGISEKSSSVGPVRPAPPGLLTPRNRRVVAGRSVPFGSSPLVAGSGELRRTPVVSMQPVQPPRSSLASTSIGDAMSSSSLYGPLPLRPNGASFVRPTRESFQSRGHYHTSEGAKASIFARPAVATTPNAANTKDEGFFSTFFRKMVNGVVG